MQCVRLAAHHHACSTLSQPELGGNPVSLRAPNRPLSSSVAFLGHLGLNTVQKSKGKANESI
jgi:hypothetical protein